MWACFSVLYKLYNHVMCRYLNICDSQVVLPKMIMTISTFASTEKRKVVSSLEEFNPWSDFSLLITDIKVKNSKGFDSKA